MSEREMSPAEAVYRHAQVLSRALHTGQAVIYKDKSAFIQVLAQRESGGGVEVTAYLKGSPVEVPANEITMKEQPE